MLRVSTLYASSAAATAAYYTRYLTEAPGEQPGVWSGNQAAGLGLAGEVTAEALQTLLEGRDPFSGSRLGRELVDRLKVNGAVVRAVAGFDATFSAPKSLSVWWALTGDDRLLAAHDAAVTGALEHLERFGSTTRVRVDGRRLHPESHGLTIASFRQSTSRDDDPQIHTHAVISAKVQTLDGRWYALDARYLKRHQRMLGGLYQSLLRSELTHRFGVTWSEIVNGQAEIAGVPRDLLQTFSKRSVEIDEALADKIDEFIDRQGRTPTRFEHAALEREAAKDTRHRKTGVGVADLAARWRTEAEAVGWTAPGLTEAIDVAGPEQAGRPMPGLTVGEVIESVSSGSSTWGRADVLRAICDGQQPVTGMPAQRWLGVLERAADRVVEHCVDLDPPGTTSRRSSDGRSLWIEPTAPGLTSEAVLVEEEAIVAWAIEAQLAEPNPSTTVNVDGLDVLQADAAAAVAGWDDLVLVVGPAGTGKTTMLARAREDLHCHSAPVFGLAPTAKAARVLERDTGIAADTVAKLLYEWSRPELEPGSPYRLPKNTTMVVDEAGMIGTHDLARLVMLAEQNHWRLVLVGDPRQLQAVGRGGLFDELCRNGRVHQLEQIHRFTHRWEAEASLQLRTGDPRALDAYEAHGRIIPGTLEAHLGEIAKRWVDHHNRGETLALVASTNEHVDLLNAAVLNVRLSAGELDSDTAVDIAGGERAHVGDVVATRRNNRRVISTEGEPVRNRELWTVTATHPDGSLSVSHNEGHGQVDLPADYVKEHVRLGYAATEHGYESDTVTIGINLASEATTRRGLYVAVTRGRQENWIHVVTDSADVTEARGVLERVLAVDLADVPAVTQRRRLAEQHQPEPAPTPPSQPGRCDVPDWFHELHREVRHELQMAEQTASANALERERLETDLADARGTLSRVDAATRPTRDRLVRAEQERDEARRDYAAAARHFDAVGFRGRRGARRDVVAADNKLKWATHDLEQVETEVCADVERYRAAWRRVETLGDRLRHHDRSALIDQYRIDRMPRLAAQLDALDTWRRWALGDSIDVMPLGGAVDTLRSAGGHCRALAQAVQEWSGNAGIHLPVPGSVTTTVEVAGPELGL